MHKKEIILLGVSARCWALKIFLKVKSAQGNAPAILPTLQVHIVL
jgi:hypothetical protein